MRENIDTRARHRKTQRTFETRPHHRRKKKASETKPHHIRRKHLRQGFGIRRHTAFETEPREKEETFNFETRPRCGK